MSETDSDQSPEDFIRSIMKRPLREPSEAEKRFLEESEKSELEELSRIKKEAQASRKYPVTAESIYQELSSPEFTSRLSQFLQTKLHAAKKSAAPKTKKDIITDLLHSVYGEIDHTVPEKGFQVLQTYSLSNVRYTPIKSGTSLGVSTLEVEGSLNPDLFLLFDVHHEPTDKGSLYRLPPLPSVIGADSDYEGDLRVLASTRELHEEDFGVDIRPIKVIMQGGNNFGRLLIIQEKDEGHTVQQLRDLDRELDALAPDTAAEIYIQKIQDAGYNFWVSGLGNKIQLPSTKELRGFEFTPANSSFTQDK